MSDEIKEILDNLIRYRYSDDKCKQPEDILTTEDMWLLLDYITNLQQKYEGAILIGKELNRDNNRLRIIEEKYKDSQEYVVAFKKEIEDLQQENENLKDFNNKLQAAKDRLDKYDRENQLEIDRLNNIINELEKSINEEIERTNNFILEDSSLIGINNIRKMLNDDRQYWLYELKELKENNNE